MPTSRMPFQLPAKLPLSLARVRDYWESLKRNENSMPFWDDVKLASLSELSDCLMLVDVFEHPQRFRFNVVGQQILDRYGASVVGKFVDEIDVKVPFEYFTAQSSATVEAKAATLYSRGTPRGARPHSGYGRLLLPMWGDGRIGMMLCAITDEQNG